MKFSRKIIPIFINNLLCKWYELALYIIQVIIQKLKHATFSINRLTADCDTVFSKVFAHKYIITDGGTFVKYKHIIYVS